MSHRFSRLVPLRGTTRVAALVAGAMFALAGSLISGSAAQAAALPTVSVAVTPTSITVGGTLQSGGVNIVSTATGVKEANVQIAQLKPGVSPAELYAYLESKHAKDINASSKFGSIVASTEVESGHPSEVQTTLQPGQYVALAGTGEGPPKLHTSFNVTAAKAPASLPAPQATIHAIEFGFMGPTTLHVGELVGFENEGWLVHMDVALQVKNLKAAKKFVQLLLAGKERSAQKMIVGGFTLAGPVSHGAYQQETITAKPGVYVEVCFMETQDKRDHTRLGMEKIIKVVK